MSGPASMSMVFRRDALMPHRPDGMGRGLMLAIAVHIGLVIALAIGVHWKSREPETMSAELWSAVPQTAAPRAVEPEPPPPPPPQPRPVPPAPPPPKAATPPPQPDAEIAIERARRQKEIEERAHEQQEAAHREREEKQRQEAEKRAAADKRAADKAAAERQAAKERERQQQAEAEAQKKKQQDERDAAKRAELRKQQLARIMGQADATGDERSTGRALQSSGPSAGYAGRIRAAVRPNIVFTDDVVGNPKAEVEVRLAPDGTIVGTPRLLKSSGSKAWDDTVIRALVKTERLPRDVDGHVEPSMVLEFRPRE